MKLIPLLVIATTAIALSACKPADPPAAPVGRAPTLARAPTPAPIAAAPLNIAIPTTGVLECDHFLKILACVGKQAPADQRESFQQRIEESRVTWRRASANAGEQVNAAKTCATGIEQAKAQFPNCIM